MSTSLFEAMKAFNLQARRGITIYKRQAEAPALRDSTTVISVGTAPGRAISTDPTEIPW